MRACVGMRGALVAVPQAFICPVTEQLCLAARRSARHSEQLLAGLVVGNLAIKIFIYFFCLTARMVAFFFFFFGR